MKNGKTIFWILIVLSVLLAITDGVLTYIATPDLEFEGNPLVSVLGLGWGALFAANVVILSLFAILMYFAFVKYESPLLPYARFTQFFSMLFYRRPDKFVWSFYKPPKNWKPFVAMVGYAAGFVMPVNRTVIVFEWILWLSQSPIRDAYGSFRLLFPFGRFDITLTAILTLLLIVFWFFKEFQINKKRVLLAGRENGSAAG